MMLLIAAILHGDGRAALSSVQPKMGVGDNETTEDFLLKSKEPLRFAKKPQLGGMYFEVRRDRFVVRAYSATEGKFFDEIPGCAHLTQELSSSYFTRYG